MSTATQVQEKRAYRQASAIKPQIVMALGEPSSVKEVADQIGVPVQAAKRVLSMLVDEGVVVQKGTRKHEGENGPSRGRPVHVFKLTRKGSDRRRRALKKVNSDA